MGGEAFPQSRYALCNGLRLHYLEWGDPRARTLLLLHGLHGCAYEWEDFAKSAGRDFHVIALDMRGHGDSEWSPDASYRVEDYLSDLTSFTKGLELEGFDLVGASLGGIVAIAFAAMNPGQVGRLVIVDIGPDIAPQGLEQIRQSAKARPAAFADLDEALHWETSGQPPQDDAALRRSLGLRLRPRPDGGLEWKYDPAVDRVVEPGTPRNPGLLWQLWTAIACPTLLVRGQSSELLAPETARRMAEVNSRATLVEVPQASHAVLADNPEGFRHAVAAFLRG